MDKGRHPHVIRTWTVERTKVLHRPQQTMKPRAGSQQNIFRASGKNQPRPGSAPKRGE